MIEEVKVIENTENTEKTELTQEPERVIVFEEAIEAILFAAGHPVTYQTLARVFNTTPSDVKDKVFEYSPSPAVQRTTYLPSSQWIPSDEA